MFAVQTVVVVQVLQQPRFGLQHFGFGQVFTGFQVVRHFTKNPRAALRSAADHDGVRARNTQHFARLFGRGDVAVGHHRNGERCLHSGHGVVLCFALVALFARAPVHRHHGHARAFRSARDAHRIAFGVAPTGAHFQSHRHLVRCACGHHGFNDVKRQRLVLH